MPRGKKSTNPVPRPAPPSFTDGEKKDLAWLVQSNTCLWDLGDINHQNTLAQAATWEFIATTMQKPSKLIKITSVLKLISLLRYYLTLPCNNLPKIFSFQNQNARVSGSPCTVHFVTITTDTRKSLSQERGLTSSQKKMMYSVTFQMS